MMPDMAWAASSFRTEYRRSRNAFREPSNFVHLASDTIDGHLVGVFRAGVVGSNAALRAL